MPPACHVRTACMRPTCVPLPLTLTLTRILTQVMEQQAQASGHGWGAQETQEYLSRFRRARESFLYQRVYDPARFACGWVGGDN